MAGVPWVLLTEQTRFPSALVWLRILTRSGARGLSNAFPACVGASLLVWRAQVSFRGWGVLPGRGVGGFHTVRDFRSAPALWGALASASPEVPAGLSFPVTCSGAGCWPRGGGGAPSAWLLFPASGAVSSGTLCPALRLPGSACRSPGGFHFQELPTSPLQTAALGGLPETRDFAS